jgi:hypothetical protein
VWLFEQGVRAFARRAARGERRRPGGRHDRPLGALVRPSPAAHGGRLAGGGGGERRRLCDAPLRRADEQSTFTGTPESQRALDLIQQHLGRKQPLLDVVIVTSAAQTVAEPGFRRRVGSLQAGLARLRSTGVRVGPTCACATRIQASTGRSAPRAGQRARG